MSWIGWAGSLGRVVRPIVAGCDLFVLWTDYNAAVISFVERW